MFVLIVASFGAAGLAASMGKHLAVRMDWSPTNLRSFLGGALALELAAAFPFLGWLIVIPITIIVCLGASLFALLGWLPEPQTEGASPKGVEGSLAGEPQSA